MATQRPPWSRIMSTTPAPALVRPAIVPPPPAQPQPQPEVAAATTQAAPSAAITMTVTLQSKDINKLSDSEMRLISIAGENRGTLMEKASASSSSSSSSSSSENKLSGDITSDNDEEEDINKKECRQHIPTFLNNNVQGLNNSIVFNTNCHHSSPGIHLSQSMDPSMDIMQSYKIL